MSTSVTESVDGASGSDDVHVAEFAATGSKIGSVPVRISYGIIERFSEGLYSSPNKTFEELITNSYDAGASEVWVYLAADLSTPDAKLVVIDDGESMDQQGLENLWRIGESKKRTQEAPPGRRQPVGKFGIGKLATYVLGTQLTYIAHQNGEYLAVTMDYSRVAQTTEMLDGVNLSLDVIQHTKESALEAVRDSLQSTAAGDSAAVLAKLGSMDHWTAAVLSELKPTAREIKLGRLRWVLRSALPLNPQFALALNDEAVVSSKVDGDVSWTFVVGKDDATLTKSAERPWGPSEPTTITVGEGSGARSEAGIRLPNAGRIWGTASLYKQPLERGRSEELGRSHGYFVRVRGRLINLYDEDFSVGPELRHGTLTRFRMEVNADDLDDQVASARESLKESKALQELKNYLLAVFNKARSISAEEDNGDVLATISKSGRLAQPSNALTQGPLRRMLQRAASGDSAVSDSLGIDPEKTSEVADLLHEGGNVVDNVLLEASDSRGPLVAFDPVRRAAVLNQSHPFISNYIGAKTVAEPLKLFGLSELLTQAYLLDENVPADLVARVMKRRDIFLRELTYRFPRSASIIAQALRDATNDENALEDAVGDALELLGYDVTRLGGATHGTDGIATARLGQRGQGSSDTYAFTYDAKSTKDSVREVLQEDMEHVAAKPTPGKIRADTARTSILKVHRERAKEAHDLQIAPSFTLLIAPDFQGALTTDGLINDVCVNDEITAIRVEDLARLVELFALQGLNPNDLRPLFDARTPEETRKWVDAQSAEARVPRPPVAILVETLVENSERKYPTSFEAVAVLLSTKGHDLEISEVEALVRGLAALAPKSVYADDRLVALNSTPAALYAEMRESLDAFDPELVQEYLGTVPTGKA